jgi:hypothetical protein
MHIYKYVQTYYKFSPSVSVIPVTIFRVSYKQSTINVQIIVQKCTVQPLVFTWFLCVASRGFITHFCTITCILIVFLLYDTLMLVTGVTETVGEK